MMCNFISVLTAMVEDKFHDYQEIMKAGLRKDRLEILTNINLIEKFNKEKVEIENLMDTFHNREKR